MQIISSRRLLFQHIEYHDEVVDGKETGRKVHNVKAKIIVNADTRPQVVPDWVKDDELFKVSVEDGTVLEITVAEKPVKALTGVSNGPLSGVDKDKPDVAKFVGDAPNNAEKPTGWATGNTAQTGLDKS